MTGTVSTTTVNGKTFQVWSDYIKRGTFARCEETGEVQMLCCGGYISKYLTVRKAIAAAFRLPTFRK